MLPPVIPEQLIYLFNFYLNGCMQRGMRHNSEIYCLLQEMDSAQQSKAYQIACDLTEQGSQVAITKSKQRYAIWVNLRSPIFPTSETANAANMAVLSRV
jgi:transcriptional regulatory protein LevR